MTAPGGPLALAGAVRLGDVALRFELAVEPGRHVVVLGPNGSGKSTMLRTLAGLQPLDEGLLRHDGRVLDEPSSATFVPPHHRGIAIQPQDGALFPHLSALDNVAFPSRAAGASRRAARQRAQELLERVDAAELAARRPGELSGGQAARVALARSMAADPRVLLLDEPAAALDVEARAELRHVVDAIDRTVITVTHDPVEARLLGRDVVVLDGGATVQVGTIEEVVEAPATAWVAGLLGLNIVTGHASGTEVSVPGGAVLALAERAHGPVHVTFPANAVALHQERPRGSARNVFEATVTSLAADGDRVRVGLHAGFEAAAMVTAASARELGLHPAGRVWASVKATELTALPA